MACSRFAVPLAIALVACGSGPKYVEVSGTPGDLRFTVVAAEGADPACAQNLSVTPVVPEDAYPAWQVSSLGADTCFDTLRYGAVAADITQRTPATALRPNVAYHVSIWGPGFMVGRDFRLTSKGVTVLD